MSLCPLVQTSSLLEKDTSISKVVTALSIRHNHGERGGGVGCYQLSQPRFYSVCLGTVDKRKSVL